MSRAAPLQTQATPLPSWSPAAAARWLQRKCACGSPTSSLTSDCGERSCKNRMQTKLAISSVNDPLEAEADRVADQVLAGSAHSKIGASSPRVQRYTGQTKKGTDTAPASVDRVLANSGNPMEPALRLDMEQRFAHDFSRVRVHSGGAAERSAHDVSANAYTVGDNIVFGAHRFAPATSEGRRLIAHELTHVIQQDGHRPALQRDVRGPKATATPVDWKDRVAKATTAADRAALIQSIVTPVKVVDKTVDAATDAAVNPNNCVKWDDTSPTVSYDDNLNAKKNRAANAGFTKEITSGASAASKTDFYIVLGPKALDAKDVTTTIMILNHEFDHVRGTRGGDTLTGDESEIATWTTTFVREFHRSYSFRDRSDGVTSYIDPGYATFTQLGGYYARSKDTKVKANAVDKIATYYTAIIKPHAVHDKVFRYWIHRGINALGMAALCGDLNDKLGKIVDSTKAVKDYWEMPTADIKAATFTGPPAVTVP
jgi:Domain of unknown function (DUF4157)